MKCPICNATLREEDLICPQCGAMIEKGKKIDQPKTEDIMEFDVFEEEEAEEERVESMRIVDGFYKSNKKREQVQKVLDQACDEIRRNGVIIISSEPAPGFEDIKAAWLEKAEISEEKIVSGTDAEAVEAEEDIEITVPDAMETTDEDDYVEIVDGHVMGSEEETTGTSETADNLISDPEDEQDIEDAKYDDAFDAEIAAIMAEIESAVGAGETDSKLEEMERILKSEIEKEEVPAETKTAAKETETEAAKETETEAAKEAKAVAKEEKAAIKDATEDIARDVSESEANGIEAKGREKDSANEESEANKDSEANKESIVNKLGKTGKKISLFHLALLIIVIISLAFLLIITIGRDTAIGRKVIQLFYASAIWDRAGIMLAAGDLLRII